MVGSRGHAGHPRCGMHADDREQGLRTSEISLSPSWHAPGKRPFILAGALLALLLALAVTLAWRVIAEERARDLEAWQIRLGILAEGRVAAIRDWLDRQSAELAGLAENTSVQLYLSELAAAGGDAAQVTDAAAQESYLRNLLIVTAERSGFGAPARAPAVAANIQPLAVAGLAVLDADRRPRVATPAMPPLDGRLASWIQSAAPGKPALLDIFPGADGAPAMGFLAPVFAVEGGAGASRQVGYVVGVRPVAAALFPLLRTPGPPEAGAATLLVRPEGAAIAFLSPLADGTPALQRRLAKDTPDLAAAFAVAEPGGFAEKRDAEGAPVLVTGRAVPWTPWTLVYEVRQDVALAESDRRATRLVSAFALALIIVAGGLAAVWYQASSHRARAAAGAFAAMAKRFEQQSELLRLVTDSQPNAVFIADELGRYRFANLETERRTGLAEPDLIGKTLDAVLGPAAAARYLERNAEALGTGRRINALDRIEEADGVSIRQTAHVPLAAGLDRPRGVLVIEEDVTALFRERERRERVLKQLVRAMSAAIDRRDRFAADQSVRVAAIARATAEEMALDPALVEAAETAGMLVNFGKILVPPELLTKAERLKEDEIRLIRSAIEATADFLAGIEFDGPVIETLRLMQEHWDGSGPHGLAGEAIPVTARIVAAANAFVAIASPRAWRPGSDLDGALTQLLGEIGTRFDRRVVAALVSYLDNHGGRARWAALTEGRARAPGAPAA